MGQLPFRQLVQLSAQTTSFCQYQLEDRTVGCVNYTIQNFFKKKQTSWISVSKLAIDPEPGSAHHDDFGRGFVPSEIIIGVQIQDQGSMASFDTLSNLFSETNLDVIN